MVMEIVLSKCKNGDIYICPDKKLYDLEYADDVMLLSEDPKKLQAFLNRLNNSQGTFGMHSHLRNIKSC